MATAVTLHVALFAKAPRPGVVKTRLSPALPATDAAALYLAFLEDAAARVARARGAHRVLYLADDGGPTSAVSPAAVGPATTWNRAFDEIRPQHGANLGERMAHAFAEMLGLPGDRAVILGTDSPDLPENTIALAVAALERADVVLGPARDGGYYLIGLKQPRPELFDGVEWGSNRVLGLTRERARSIGLRLEELPVGWDVDEPSDLAALVARALDAGTRTRCPATARALSELGLLPARLP